MQANTHKESRPGPKSSQQRDIQVKVLWCNLLLIGSRGFIQGRGRHRGRAGDSPVHAAGPVIEEAGKDSQIASNVSSRAYASHLKLA